MNLNNLSVVRVGLLDGYGYHVLVGGKRKGVIYDRDIVDNGLPLRPLSALKLARELMANISVLIEIRDLLSSDFGKEFRGAA